MAPKGGNAKKESGKAKKAENEAKKRDEVAAEKERKEATKWDAGAKGAGAKEDKEAKRREALAAKAERERMLAAEEAVIASAKPKAAPKAGQKATNKKNVVVQKPAGPGALAAGGGLAAVAPPGEETRPGVVESYTATGIDDALDMLQVVNARTDKASVGQQAAGLEKHPERRFKAAFEAYKQRELSELRKDHPGLRLVQYNELLYKQFQKSSDNPFNQTLVSYDATKDDKVAALDKHNKEIEERLRDQTAAMTLNEK